MIPVSPTGRRVAALTGFSACFAVSAAISISLTRSVPGVSTLWTANAFLIAALLMLPRRWGAACAVVCGLANVGAYLAAGDAVAPSLVLSGLNLAESAAVAWMTRRVCGAALRIDDLKRIGRLIGLAILPACAASATIAAAYLHLARGRPLAGVWRDWGLAHAVGLAVMLPALLILLRGKQEAAFRRSPLETGVLGVLVAGAAFLVCGQTVLPLPFAVYGALTLVAFRLGPRGAVLGTLLVAAIAIPLLMAGIGPMPANPRLTPVQRLQMTQFFILAAFYAALLTATAVAGQARMRRLFLKRMQVAREARARAIAASAAKTDFLATMSHEIRTPLNSIIGFTRLLADDSDIPAHARRRLGLIDSASASLLTVVNDILDFSRVEAGEVQLELRPVSIRQVAEDAVAIAAESAALKQLELKLHLSGPLDEPHLADEGRIRQVILNLLNNAVKFTETGTVELRVAVTRGEPVDAVRFAVEDTGVGIPLDRRDRLFERFSQIDSSVARTHGGTGLGLAICKGLVQVMGGVIGVTSEPGHGSSFWFEVPLRRAQPAASAPAAAPAADLGGTRVLLVDDHPMNRELGSALLTIMGCEVDLAENGAEAVEAARTRAYDAIIMDVHMPVMDGLAATRAIRALPGHAATTPIIAMTADVLPEHVERCRLAGMIGHVAKPVRPEALHAALVLCLSGAPAPAFEGSTSRAG